MAPGGQMPAGREPLLQDRNLQLDPHVPRPACHPDPTPPLESSISLLSPQVVHILGKIHCDSGTLVFSIKIASTLKTRAISKKGRAGIQRLFQP